jgi:hypothetical protein
MTDKKKIDSIIKTLERIIGILENCRDTNEMSEATHRRIIQFLNASMLDLYFVKSAEQEAKHETEELSATTVTDKPESDVEDSSLYKENINPVQEVHEEPATLSLQDMMVEESEQQAEQSSLEQVEELEQQAEQIVEPVQTSEPVQMPEPVQTPEPVETEQITAPEPEQPAVIEPEQPVIPEPEFSSPTIQLTDAPVVEWDTTPIQVAEEPKEDPDISKERESLEGLRQQLEIERTRLLEELKIWQEEKMKREEEMLASQRLLATLAAEEQRRKAQLESAEQPAKQTPPAVAVPVQQQVTQPIQSNPKPVQNPTGGNTKVLHESFENDELKIQGITPVADLSKAIAINEKFQFIKELFGGDSDLYVETIRALNNAGSLGAAISYIDSHFSWDKNSEATRRLIMLLRRRFM